MSYHSRFTGKITFEPALTWQEIKDSEFLGDANEDDIAIQVVEHELGAVIVRVGRYLIGGDEDFTRRGVLDAFNTFAQEFDLGNGRATGYLIQIGEEQGDVTRHFFDADGKYQSEVAELRWSDGTKVEL